MARLIGCLAVGVIAAPAICGGLFFAWMLLGGDQPTLLEF